MKKNILIGSIFSALFLITTSHANESTRLGETPSELTKRWREGERGKNNEGFPTIKWKKAKYNITVFFTPKKYLCWKIIVEKGWDNDILKKEEAIQFIQQFCEGIRFSKDKHNREDKYSVKSSNIIAEYSNWYWPQAGAQLGKLTITDTRLEKFAWTEREQVLRAEEKSNFRSNTNPIINNL